MRLMPHGAEPTLSAYVHVPYCLRRCGYCDFNTYANFSLGPGVGGYAEALIREIHLVAQTTAGSARGLCPLKTVFFGGGTPTVLPASDLVKILEALRETFGVTPDAEITTEANPDTVDETYLEQLVGGGFTRVSLGMQSSVPHVLATLDRTHTPAHLEAAVRAAQGLGLRTSVDLIYGTPGESLADWKASLEGALALGVAHVSCYALTIEPGTALGRASSRGEIAPVDGDDQADKYEVADRVLSAAGLEWYEISNWAVPGEECRHNLAYWRNQDWFGFGPGAHSHLGDKRWWEWKSPVKWAQYLEAGRAPIADGEVIKGAAAWLEHVLLNIRLREGLDLGAAESSGTELSSEANQDGLDLGSVKTAEEGLGPAERSERSGAEGEAWDKSGWSGRLEPGVELRDDRGWREPRDLREVAKELADEGLLDAGVLADEGRAVLTLKGRLLADAVTRRLSD